ncbi:sulfurtransferase TusA family protein [Paenibacillus dokdonensis]|uniref:Sulfurtransferase TusA family protein n=1 Tax=Paenibacillus dokdonensis TaxID=2567944 RepID=A0ABU6GTC0_9BACL|nr:sulfurtransferase TusA family protein [Paenibacillus dokdonensis]MEC0242367.1 sulfurtransferase TusA family protein [Paenibacillus dokdonensis]
MNADKVLDAKGLACPMPIVRTKKAIEELQTGQILEVQSTDKGSINDLTGWANSTGHQLLENREENGIYTFWIKKK